jgi:hypothetical protein
VLCASFAHGTASLMLSSLVSAYQPTRTWRRPALEGRNLTQFVWCTAPLNLCSLPPISYDGSWLRDQQDIPLPVGLYTPLQVPRLELWFIAAAGFVLAGALPNCRLEVSIQKVLRPATSAHVFLGFPVSTSEC